MRLHRQIRKRVDVPIVPMIDILFILLVYIIVSTTFKKPRSILRIERKFSFAHCHTDLRLSIEIRQRPAQGRSQTVTMRRQGRRQFHAAERALCKCFCQDSICGGDPAKEADTLRFRPGNFAFRGQITRLALRHREIRQGKIRWPGNRAVCFAQ